MVITSLLIFQLQMPPAAQKPRLKLILLLVKPTDNNFLD
uniref:Uncharacterized protein n=1 Tax=Anguilla anguilla TaxID=7936 RepID=A0A0E9W4Y8_ANGAN